MELQFVIMIDTEGNVDTITDSLQLTLAETAKVSPHSFNWKGNWIQIWKNDDYNRELMNDSDEGFLYYPFRLEVSPNNDDLTVEQQVGLAKLLGQKISGLGYHFEICADFEEYL